MVVLLLESVLLLMRVIVSSLLLPDLLSCFAEHVGTLEASEVPLSPFRLESLGSVPSDELVFFCLLEFLLESVGVSIESPRLLAIRCIAD